MDRDVAWSTDLLWPMNLTQYERFKLDLAALLRSREVAQSAYVSERDALLARLAGDKFNLVTVGRFSRGKSTLMNALLQTTLLPMGIIPLTSVVTIVKYGSLPRTTLYYRGTDLFINTSIDDLEKYITQTGNPGNQAGISRAEIELPAALLRYGFRFVDTPGLGSVITENTATTLNFLPEADALLVVTSFDSALSTEEMTLLHVAKKQGIQVFLAVNKADLVNEDEKNQVLGHIEDRLAQEKIETVKIFPVCATAGLTQTSKDIDALREAIITFCVVAGQTKFLTVIVEKIKILLEKANDQEGLAWLAHINRRLLDYTSSEEGSHLGGVVQRRSCPICEALGQVSFKEISKLQFELSQTMSIRERFSKGPGLCALHAMQFGKIANPLAVACSLADDFEAIIHRLDDAGCDPVTGACPICAILQEAEVDEIKKLADSALDTPALICLPHFPKLLAALPVPRRVQIYRLMIKQYEGLAEDLRRYALRREGALRSAISVDENRAAADVINTLAGHADAWWST